MGFETLLPMGLSVLGSALKGSGGGGGGQQPQAAAPPPIPRPMQPDSLGAHGPLMQPPASVFDPPDPWDPKGAKPPSMLGAGGDFDIQGLLKMLGGA